jgi:osmotically-inducible protein OsmY
MKAVESALLAARLEIENLTVAADGSGNVALSGVVRSPGVAHCADDTARAVNGVKMLMNGLTVA